MTCISIATAPLLHNSSTPFSEAECYFPFATAAGAGGATRVNCVDLPSIQYKPPMQPIKTNAAITVQRPGRSGLRKRRRLAISKCDTACRTVPVRL